MPKPKKAKILTHQPKSYLLERATKLPTAGTSKAEAAEAAEETLSVLEVTAVRTSPPFIWN